MIESDFLLQITKLAEILGWRWVHFRPAQTAHGWRTPVQGPLGAGWPDLVLVRERLVFAELKVDGKHASPAQIEVGADLAYAGASWFVWHPADFDAIVAELSRRT